MQTSYEAEEMKANKDAANRGTRYIFKTNSNEMHVLDVPHRELK